jgi:hypothetical protein
VHLEILWLGLQNDWVARANAVEQRRDEPIARVGETETGHDASERDESPCLMIMPATWPIANTRASVAEIDPNLAV